MKKNVIIKLVESDIELIQILNLQNLNHLDNLTNEEKKNNGFLTVKHEFHILQEMNLSTAQIIAVDNKLVVGYALAMLKKHSELVPSLVTMFQMFEKLSFNGQCLKDFYVMGQICISEDYRGQEIFEKMYGMHKSVYGKEFKRCLTEVSSSNLRSMRAHEKIGFQKTHNYQDATGNWNIMLWDWN